MPAKIYKNIRPYVYFLYAAVVSGYFWVWSRYPAIGHKIDMGGKVQFLGIAFDPKWKFLQADSLANRVLYSTLNWYETNWKGMTFALLFAPVLILLLKSLRLPRIKNRFLQLIVGSFIGAPLGVCVNCVTPIVLGMQRANMPRAMMLSTMVSSPTLNVLGVTLLFALFPWHLAVLKLIAVGAVIFLVIPTVLRLAGKENEEIVFAATPETADISRGYLFQIFDAVRLYLIELGKVLLISLPLMALSGFLGALLVEAFPLRQMGGIASGYFSFFLAALVGTLLPVPMTFDVIFPHYMMNSGFGVGATMALLATLGIFSVYPLLSLLKYFGKKTAFGMFAGVVVTGFFAAAVAHNQDKAYVTQVLDEVKLAEEARTQYLQRVVEACKTVEQQEPKLFADVRCVDTFVERESRRTGAVALCGLISNPKDQRACESHNLVHFDLKACLALSEPNARRDCVEKGLIQEADVNPIGVSNDEFAMMGIRIYEVCGRLPTGFGEICEDLDQFFTAGRSVASCRLIDNAVLRDRCVGIAYSYEAMEARTPKPCDEIPQTAAKETCRASVIAYTSTNDASSVVEKKCAGLASSDECRRIWAWRKANDKGEPSACVALAEGSPEKKECLALALHRTVLTKVGQLELSGISALIRADLDNKPGKPVGRELPGFRATPPLALNFKRKTAEVNGTIAGLKVSTLPKVDYPRVADHFVKTSTAPLGATFTGGFEGIASGDIDRDGWLDLLMVDGEGRVVLLKMNDRGAWEGRPLDVRVEGERISHVALADITGDGWPELFVATNEGQLQYFVNTKGSWNFSSPLVLKKVPGTRQTTLSFADLDKNGYLDLVVGQTSMHGNVGLPRKVVRGDVFLNFGGKLTRSDILDNRAENLSTLLMDVDGDGWVDAWFGNDFEIPDFLYLNKAGHFQRAPWRGVNIDRITGATMSLDSGDVNNDLVPEVFASDMTVSASGEDNFCSHIEDKDYREACLDDLDKDRLIHYEWLDSCKNLVFNTHRQHCVYGILSRLARRWGGGNICDNLSDPFTYNHLGCKNGGYTEPERAIYIPEKNEIKQKTKNALLFRDANGKWQDLSERMGVESSYYTWNSRIADLDNDGWQDIYVANGEPGSDEFFRKILYNSNIFFKNMKGERFVKAEADAGLVDFVPTGSFTLADLNNDGALDIISIGLYAPPRVFMNEYKNNGIEFRLDDATAHNRDAIGARVEILSNTGQRQMREVKLSGGYKSQNPPTAHFGLGSADTVLEVKITWPDGTQNVLKQQWPANNVYLIARGAKAGAR